MGIESVDEYPIPTEFKDAHALRVDQDQSYAESIAKPGWVTGVASRKTSARGSATSCLLPVPGASHNVSTER